jgi:hypothetical protein
MVGGIGGSALSAALFLFRDQCEPILRLLVPLLVGRRSHFHYDPEDYYFFASLAVVMTLVWISLTILAVVRKPLEDKRIDTALRVKERQFARGAPLEPR